jgi:hypothetical protein
MGNTVDCTNMDVKEIDALPVANLEYDQGDKAIVDYDSLSDLIDEANHFKKVLCRILEPDRYMQEKADAEGNEINGMVSVQLSENAAFLQKLAREGIETNPRERHISREESIRRAKGSLL